MLYEAGLLGCYAVALRFVWLVGSNVVQHDKTFFPVFSGRKIEAFVFFFSGLFRSDFRLIFTGKNRKKRSCPCMHIIYIKICKYYAGGGFTVYFSVLNGHSTQNSRAIQVASLT